MNLYTAIVARFSLCVNEVKVLEKNLEDMSANVAASHCADIVEKMAAIEVLIAEVRNTANLMRPILEAAGEPVGVLSKTVYNWNQKHG